MDGGVILVNISIITRERRYAIDVGRKGYLFDEHLHQRQQQRPPLPGLSRAFPCLSRRQMRVAVHAFVTCNVKEPEIEVSGFLSSYRRAEVVMDDTTERGSETGSLAIR
jgi:hypothetical protein